MNDYVHVSFVCAGLNLRECIQGEVRESGVSSDVFGDLTSKMADYLVQSRSVNTNTKYLSYFNKWKSFIEDKGLSPIPASPVHVALYVTDLIDKNVSSSVISATVYSIKWAHSLKNLPDPTNNSFVVNLLETAKRTLSKPVQKKEPISSDSIKQLCDMYSYSTDVLILRDLCMILVAYSGFLRFDELIHLKCNDIVFHDDYFTIEIRKSKTDQYRLGNQIVISKGFSSACPFNMLQKYLKYANLSCSKDCFLFRPVVRSKAICKLISKDKPLSYTRTRECLVSRLREVVGDSNIGIHSLRAGGATCAANAGVNDRCWKRHGRWKSETSKDGYACDSLERRLSVSKSLDL